MQSQRQSCATAGSKLFKASMREPMRTCPGTSCPVYLNWTRPLLALAAAEQALSLTTCMLHSVQEQVNPCEHVMAHHALYRYTVQGLCWHLWLLSKPCVLPNACDVRCRSKRSAGVHCHRAGLLAPPGNAPWLHHLHGHLCPRGVGHLCWHCPQWRCQVRLPT